VCGAAAREQVASNFFTTDRGNILQGYGSFFNHSCDPNAEWRFHANGQFVVRTIKNIKPREEVRCMVAGRVFTFCTLNWANFI
jgi:hypothetical protein